LSLDDLLGPPGAGAVRSAVKDPLGADAASPLTLETVRRDGARFRVEVSVVAQRAADGTVAGLLGVVRDVEPRVEAESALRDALFRYRTQFNSLPEPTTVWSREGVLLMQNRKSAANLGGRVEDFLGRSMTSVLGPAGASYLARVQQVIDSGQPETREDVVPLPGVGERVFWTCIQRVPMPDSSTAAQVISYDITDRKRMEVDLQDARQRLEERVAERTAQLTRALADLEGQLEERRRLDERARLLATALEQSGDMAVVATAQGTIQWANQGAARLSGKTSESLASCGLAGLDLGHERRSVAELAQQVVRTGQGWRGRLVGTGTQGPGRTCDVTLSPVRGEDGALTHLVLVGSDVTERMALEERLQNARASEAATRLVEGLAHEVRNPLNAIDASAEALRLDLADHPDHGPLLKSILTQVDRLAGLMRELLNLRRPLRESDVGPVLLHHVCESTVRLWHDTHQRSPRAIRLFLGEGPGPVVMGDASRLQQVLLNLLDNADVHSPPGSEVQVLTRASGGNAVVEVRDLGRGLPPHHAGRVFDPFFTTRPGGVGLGLSIVQRFVELHGGWVELVNNQPAPGCTARVFLPASGGHGGTLPG
jgi:PAS domain S-box-containing protein